MCRGCSFGLPLADALAVAIGLAEGNTGAALDVIGLGPGLTPAADDVVAGALAVLALAGQLQEAARDENRSAGLHSYHRPSAALVGGSRKRTSDTAGRGRARCSCRGRSIGSTHAAVAELFRVGATSGHDLCAGMAGVLAGSTSAGTIGSTGEAATTTRSPL